MSLKTLITCAAVLVPGTATIVHGQTTLDVRPAELAVPFGAASGKVILVADQFVFIDDQQVGAPFAIARHDITALEQDGGMVTVTTSTPVRDRTGERSLLRFKLRDAASLVRWHSDASGPTTAVARQSPRPAATTISRQARHDHGLGGCEGRLIISDSRIAFESVSEIGDSRRWVFRDIRDVNQNGPCQLEITPFLGNTYNLELLGEGLDSGQFRTLVDRITSARVQ